MTAESKGNSRNLGQNSRRKRNDGMFSVLGNEPKGANLSFRPPQSLETRIRVALKESGLKVAEFLELAAIAYLEKSPDQMRHELEQLLEQKGFNADPSKPLPKNVRRLALTPESRQATQSKPTEEKKLTWKEIRARQ